MKTRKLFVALLGMLVLSSCSKKPIETRQIFDLKFGKTACVNSGTNLWEVKFEKLIKDNRCPKDAHCVSEGELAVLIIINDDFQIVIGSGQYPSMMIHEDHKLKLLDADYGKAKYQGIAENYTLTLIVE